MPPRNEVERDINDPGPIAAAIATAALTHRGRAKRGDSEATLRRSDAARQGCEARDGMGKLGPRPARASQSARLPHPGPRSRRGRSRSHGARWRRAVLALGGLSAPPSAS